MKAIDKALTDWIQFWKENWNDFKNIDNTSWKDFEFEVQDNKCIIRKDWGIFTEINIYEIITSKGHIEAVARGLENEDNFWWNGLKFDTLSGYITCKQAKAIRDGKLEEFINNIME
jgi:hypothetical protein